MKILNSSPIGIFDSGIGGLTVANALSKHLPNESMIYFGDTAHLPYGDKSPDSIKYYSIRIADFLLEKNCKAIVIACNTASAIAYEVVKKHVKNKVMVFNVIDPVVENVCEQNPKKVGVIGTKGTIKADAYAKKIKQLNSSIEVCSLATPLLAPMIEEGFFNNNISKTIINSYLSKPKLKKIDALILACTHYPLIKKEITEYYQKQINILDSADIVATKLKEKLKELNLLNLNTKKGKHHFFVSDFTKSFEKSTKLFFEGKINLEHFPMWENE
jgi:glutamate racemase